MIDEHSVRLQRTIQSSPEQVYRAWLEPELIRRWMAPGDLIVTQVEVEERPGATTLTLLHERLDALAAAHPDVAAKVEVGWADVLAKLAGLLPSVRASFR